MIQIRLQPGEPHYFHAGDIGNANCCKVVWSVPGGRQPGNVGPTIWERDLQTGQSIRHTPLPLQRLQFHLDFSDGTPELEFRNESLRTEMVCEVQFLTRRS